MRPAVRLGLCLATVVVPLLLLTTPGQAATRAARADRYAVATGTLRRRAAPARASSPDAIVSHSVLARYAPPTMKTTLEPSTTATTAPPPPSSTSTTTTTTPPPPMSTTTTSTPLSPAPLPGDTETGLASWYAASPGTCASPTLDFGTQVMVTDLATGASVSCLVDDREADNPGRVIDLSEATFSQLAGLSTGLIEVELSW